MIIPDHVKMQTFENGWVILDCQKNYYYAVNQSGVELLKQIQDHGDVEKAIETISQSYDVPVTKLREDIIAFLNQLIEKGLIQNK